MTWEILIFIMYNMYFRIYLIIIILKPFVMYTEISLLLYVIHLEFFQNLPLTSTNSTVSNDSQLTKLTSDETVVKVYACSTYKISICNKYF